MASALYTSGQSGIGDGTIDLTGDVRVMLAQSEYVYNTTDQFVSDLGAVDNGRTAALDNPTYVAGLFDADDTMLTAISTVSCGSLILFQHTGADATARLIGYIDVANGLPVIPASGQVVNIAWDNGAHRIFEL